MGTDGHACSPDTPQPRNRQALQQPVIPSVAEGSLCLAATAEDASTTDCTDGHRWEKRRQRPRNTRMAEPERVLPTNGWALVGRLRRPGEGLSGESPSPGPSPKTSPLPALSLFSSPYPTAQHRSPNTVSPLPTASRPPPTAHCLLPTAHCLLPTVHCLLPTADCLLPTAHCRLSTVHCPLPTVHCRLPPASCRLLTAYCPLPSVHSPQLCAGMPCPTGV